MTDIFISYARSTANEAHQIAEALRALGYGVWRDDELPAHRAYAEVIAERLQAAKAVVVVWSADASRSEWVQSEADRARADHKLVQLSLDATQLPMPFDRIQCADMAGWRGDPDAPGWRKVVASVGALVGAPQAAGTPRVDLAPARARHSICVLPFANMSDDPQQEYFSDGITEDIITDLSKVSALFVVARNTAFTFKGKSVDIPHVARQLNVAHVLEGSVRKAGNRVRITAQLIDGASGGHVWAERYDRDLEDIFALQDEISEAIVGALKLRLLPEEKQAIERRGTDNVEAYNLYLMARQYLVSGNQGAQQAGETILRLCLKATELDPGYARAWALMAHAQTALRFVQGRADDGLAAAEKALSLDAGLAEAHAIRARHLHLQGRRDEATAEVDTALRLDPESYEVNESAGLLALKDRRYELAVRHYEKAAALVDTAVGVCGMLISAYTALGDAAGLRRSARMTLARAETALARDPNNGSAMGYGASALVALGEAERARDWIDRALLIDPGNSTMRYNFACGLSAHLKDIDGALDLLGPYFAVAREGDIQFARLDPDLNPLREDPRFEDMIAAAEARLASADNSAPSAGE
jgi:adenylate cyclase